MSEAKDFMWKKFVEGLGRYRCDYTTEIAFGRFYLLTIGSLLRQPDGEQVWAQERVRKWVGTQMRQIGADCARAARGSSRPCVVATDFMVTCNHDVRALKEECLTVVPDAPRTKGFGPVCPAWSEKGEGFTQYDFESVLNEVGLGDDESKRLPKAKAL